MSKKITIQLPLSTRLSMVLTDQGDLDALLRNFGAIGIYQSSQEKENQNRVVLTQFEDVRDKQEYLLFFPPSRGNPNLFSP